MEQQPQKSLFDEKRDAIARAIHAQYVRNQQGRKPPDDPAMASWEMLAEPLRESNRHQAGEIMEKLRRFGYAVRIPTTGQPTVFKFEPEEEEHERWVAERLQEGWRSGPRDPEKKMTPYLVDWDQLADEIREYDRDAVRGIPGILAEVGLEIYRQESK
jgi:hypothetical protein